MYCRSGSTTLLQLAFFREQRPNFPWKTFQWDKKRCEIKKKNSTALFVPLEYFPWEMRVSQGNVSFSIR